MCLAIIIKKITIHMRGSSKIFPGGGMRPKNNCVSRGGGGGVWGGVFRDRFAIIILCTFNKFSGRDPSDRPSRSAHDSVSFVFIILPINNLLKRLGGQQKNNRSTKFLLFSDMICLVINYHLVKKNSIYLRFKIFCYIYIQISNSSF